MLGKVYTEKHTVMTKATIQSILKIKLFSEKLRGVFKTLSKVQDITCRNR